MTKKHRFTLVLAGIAELTSEIADALYETTGGDIELGMRDGIAFLDFVRTAPSLREAIVSAMHDVDETHLGIKVVRVESEPANVIAKINAELLGVLKTG